MKKSFYNIEPLIVWTDRGLFCPKGDFYIDPHKSVERAVVTHAHSDHARRGSHQYYCERSGMSLLKTRLGQKIRVEGINYREVFTLGKVNLSFHSAGHILGSAQVRVYDPESNQVWVVSGDYKRDPDPSCEPFEVVKCDTFITEATFGTPKYTWQKGQDHGRDIFTWWEKNRSKNINSVLFGYSLGKCQRILAELAPFADRPIFIHQSMAELTDCYRQQGRILAETCLLSPLPAPPQDKLQGELILAPPSIKNSPQWMERLGTYETAFASGWMQENLHRSKSQQNHLYHQNHQYHHGFVMSDHADWNDLNQTITETEAKQIYVLHRGNGVLVRHLRHRGLKADAIEELVQPSLPHLPLFPEL